MNTPPPIKPPRLLVSVRNAEEARLCLRHVDILDLKEPQRGPLGAVEAGVLEQVIALCPPTLPLSAALGEWNQIPGKLVQAIGAAGTSVAYVKVGLAGCVSGRWPKELERLRSHFPQHVDLVPAAYADWLQVHAPPPEEVLEVIAALRGRTFMIDTAVKNGSRLWDHLPPQRVKQLVQQAQAQGCQVVLAGSLQAADLPLVQTVGADVVAVRGAVCRRGRTQLCPQRLAAFCKRLRQSPAFQTRQRQFA